MKTSQALTDKLSNGLSMACAIHCLFVVAHFINNVAKLGGSEYS